MGDRRSHHNRKPKGEEWSFETISNILGVYTKPNLFRPLEVTLHQQDRFVPNINIEADFGLIRYGSFIKGEIIYPKQKQMIIELLDNVIIPILQNKNIKIDRI